MSTTAKAAGESLLIERFIVDFSFLMQMAANGCGHAKCEVQPSIWAERSVAACLLLYAVGRHSL